MNPKVKELQLIAMKEKDDNVVVNKTAMQMILKKNNYQQLFY